MGVLVRTLKVNNRHNFSLWVYKDIKWRKVKKKKEECFEYDETIKILRIHISMGKWME